MTKEEYVQMANDLIELKKCLDTIVDRLHRIVMREFPKPEDAKNEQ